MALADPGSLAVEFNRGRARHENENLVGVVVDVRLDPLSGLHGDVVDADPVFGGGEALGDLSVGFKGPLEIQRVYDVPLRHGG